MTEEDAKGKWCPFARFGNECDNGATSVNRGWRGERNEALCIASACMAWRREEKTRDGPLVLRGYCGLAGKP